MNIVNSQILVHPRPPMLSCYSSRWMFIMQLEKQRYEILFFIYMKGPDYIITLTRLWLHMTCIMKIYSTWLSVHLFPPSPCRKINRSRPLCCPCQTTSRQDMAVPNPLEICPSRREYRGGPLEIVCIRSLLSFFQKAERKKELLT